MHKCLIIQPIDPTARAYLEQHGVTAVTATALDEQSLAEQMRDVDAVITRNLGAPRSAVATARILKVISVHGIGTDAVPLDLASEKGIIVVNTPDANALSVAEHAWALLLAAAKRVLPANQAVRNRDFHFKVRSPSVELYDRTLGLVGFGRIARRVAIMAQAFGMRVIAVSPNQPDTVFRNTGVERIADLRDLLGRSDFISLHVPLTTETCKLIAGAELSLLKSTAIVVNTSRGAVIDEDALADWLTANPDAGAGLDVFSLEPPAPGNPLLGLANAVLTPHSAASSEAALRRMGLMAAKGVVDVLSGRTPDHPVKTGALHMENAPREDE